MIVVDIAREGRYLVVHGEDDHQLPENGDEVQEELHTLPSHTNRQTLLTNRIHSQPQPKDSQRCLRALLMRRSKGSRGRHQTLMSVL